MCSHSKRISVTAPKHAHMQALSILSSPASSFAEPSTNIQLERKMKHYVQGVRWVVLGRWRSLNS